MQRFLQLVRVCAGEENIGDVRLQMLDLIGRMRVRIRTHERLYEPVSYIDFRCGGRLHASVSIWSSSSCADLSPVTARPLFGVHDGVRLCRRISSATTISATGSSSVHDSVSDTACITFSKPSSDCETVMCG